MKVSEALGAGLWAASAVMVTQYTWQACTAQFESFPQAGGAGSGATKNNVNQQAGPILSLLPGGDFGYNWLEGARHQVGQWINGKPTVKQKRPPGYQTSGQFPIR